jgi:hypothetical protein
MRARGRETSGRSERLSEDGGKETEDSDRGEETEGKLQRR